MLERAAAVIDKEGGRCASVNLMLCTTETELATTILSAVIKNVLSRSGRAKTRLEDLLRSLRISPRVTVSQSGDFSFTFDAVLSQSDWLDVLQDAVRILRDAGTTKTSVLILDEFQVVATIGKAGVGGAFKALADQAQGTSIVFAGSHYSVMEKLTAARGAPLYGMGERVILRVVPEEPMTHFLIRRSKIMGKLLSQDDAHVIYQRAGTIPNYVQQLALAAFECADVNVDVAAIENGVRAIVDRQSSDFADRFGNLAPSQQRILKALSDGPQASVFSKSFLDEVGVANHNAVTTALRALDARELVASTDGAWAITDPFFRYWLTRT